LIKIVDVHLEVLLVEVIFEMMLNFWRPPGWMQWWWLGGQAHVLEDFSNHFGIFDGCNDFHFATAFDASLNIDVEDPCE
jgi:hypothetical protein